MHNMSGKSMFSHAHNEDLAFFFYLVVSVFSKKFKKNERKEF